MENVNFHQLLLFYTVARARSFSVAAQELGVSQPAVSIQVQALERSLGTVLLERKPRGIEVTETGRAVFDYAQRIFELAREMRCAVEELHGLHRGRLTLGASSTPGEFILPGAIARFTSLHPGIRMDLVIANTAAIVERVLKRELHLGIVGDSTRCESEDLVCFPLVEDEVVFVVSPGHPLASRPSVTAREVAESGLVMREHGSATRSAVERGLRALGVAPVVVAEMGSSQAVKQATAAGLGVGALSRCAVSAEVSAGLLRVLPTADWRCTREFNLMYLKDRYLSPAQKAFLQFLREAAVPPISTAKSA